MVRKQTTPICAYGLGSKCRSSESIAGGNEEADELAKGAMLDRGFMAQARAGTVQQEREEVFAALQYAASFHCLVEELQDCEELEPKPQEKWTFANKKGKAQKHHTEWCAKAHKYRCVRCGRSSKNMKMQGTCVGPKWLTEDSTHKLGRSRRAMEVSTRNGAEGKFPSVDEDVHRNQESKGNGGNNCRWRW